MRIPVLLFLLGTLSLNAAPPTAVTPPAMGVTPLILYFRYQVEPPRVVQQAIESEVDSIISPTGWHFEWDPISDDNANVSFRLAIVHFKGGCDVANINGPPKHRVILGTTAVSQGEIQPFANVNCDAIKGMMGDTLTAVAPGNREIVFGRAVGRVLSHELYHIFANEKSHASSGVAAARFTSEELVANEFRLEPEQIQNLRLNLFSALRQMFDWRGSRASEKGASLGPSLFTTSGCSGCHGSLGQGTKWGPPLRDTGTRYDSRKLTARLSDHRSPMYRRAKQLSLLWPDLKNSEVDLLAAYLDTLAR